MKKSLSLILFILGFILFIGIGSAAVRTCTLDCVNDAYDRTLTSNFLDSVGTGGGLKVCVVEDPKNNNYLYSMSCPSIPSSNYFNQFNDDEVCMGTNTFSDEGRFLKYCPNTGFENRCPVWPKTDGKACTSLGSVPVGTVYPNDCVDNQIYICEKLPSESKATWKIKTASSSDCTNQKNTWSAWSACNATNQKIRTCNIINNQCSGVSNDCSSGQVQVASCTDVDTAFWSSTDNANTQINFSDKGDTVLMRFGGNIADTIQVNYTVQKYSENAWSQFLQFFGFSPWSQYVKLSGLAYKEVTINEQGNFSFVAISDESQKRSNNLTVSGTINNSAPNSTIIDPTAGLYYKVGNPIEFNQLSTDEDDFLLNVSWNFGDGNIEVFENYNSEINATAANTVHAYLSEGIYIVELNVKDYRTEQSKSTNNIVAITVLKEGINVIPNISSPLNGQSINQAIVNYNISGSFVANCSSNLNEYPSPSFNTTDGLLNCKYLHAPNTRQTAIDTRIYVSWFLDDGDSTDDPKGNWTDDYYSVVEFPALYLDSGEHNAKLNMSYYIS